MDPLTPIDSNVGNTIPWTDEPSGRLAMVIAFQGTTYAGWQRQANDTTVQQVVEQALSNISRQPVVIHSAGRTDAGVHATAQVAHVDIQTRLGLDELTRALNATLPDDVLIRRAGWVHPDFHARYSAKTKTYSYLIHTGRQRPLFDRHFVWHRTGELNLVAMETGAKALIGRHDFASFQSTGSGVENTVREVFEAGWELIGPDRLRFTVMADGFLRHMVRAMVGTLVAVGRGRFTPGDISGIVAKKSRAAAGPNAPARGLCLVEVDYY